MTVRVTHTTICDRCNDEFERRGPFMPTTMELAFMYFVNGSGSRVNATDRDLDKDLCDECTESFKLWWHRLET